MAYYDLVVYSSGDEGRNTLTGAGPSGSGDIDLLDAFLAGGGSLLATGSHLAGDLRYEASGAGFDFLHDWFGVTFIGNDLRPLVDGQRSPSLVPAPENTTYYSQTLIAYGGCRDRGEFDAVLAVSEQDRQALSEAAGQHLDATVIPIAIDTDEVAVVERDPAPNHILHIGTMYWPPNIDGVLWFIRQVWPLVRARKPGVQFDVVGSRPPQEIVALSGDETGINVTGYVPDPAPYFQRAALMVVPLRAGGGMRVKILNALAQGIPVVSTTLGYEGIAVTPEENILAGDTPAAFADAVVRLLDDRELAQRIARNGRRLAEEKYDYRRACAPIDDVYARAVAARSGESL